MHNTSSNITTQDELKVFFAGFASLLGFIGFAGLTYIFFDIASGNSMPSGLVLSLMNNSGLSKEIACLIIVIFTIGMFLLYSKKLIDIASGKYLTQIKESDNEQP